MLLGAVTGLVNGDTLGSIANGTAVFSTTALTGSNVGTYAETGTGVTLLNSNGNYLAITQAPGNSNAFTITPASLSYVANPTSKVYGQANPPLLGTLSGLVNGDTQSGIVTGTAVFSTTALTGSNVGTYAETGTGLTLLNSNGNYLAITQALSNGSAFTITPASLTYNAFPNFKIYGQTNPALWGFVSGFVNGDTQASATKGTALFSSNATASSNVGFYGITGSGLTANNGNYVFQQASWNPSALFVIPAILTYNANSASKIYGQANPIIGGSVSGFVNSDTLANATTGTLAFSSSASPSSNVGKYTVTGSGLTADNNNYLFVQAGSNTGDLTVKPATLTYLATAVTENTKSKPKGLTGKITGYVLGQGSSVLNGSVMWTTTATASSLAGKYPILGSGLSAQNYIFAQAGTNTAALTLVNAPGTHKSTVVYSPDPVRSSTEDNAKPESQRIARLPDMANAGKREDTADMVLSVDLDTTRTDYAQNASAAGQLFQVVNGGIRMSASLK